MDAYEVDSLVDLPDDNRVIRHDPVFLDVRDARWYVRLMRKMGMKAWITRVNRTPVKIKPEIDG